MIMENLKSYFTEKSQMFKGFFLLLKIYSLLSMLLLIFIGGTSWLILPVVIYLFTLMASATLAERFIRADNILGLYLGWGLACLMSFSLIFPLGVFGLFALLNKDFRNDYLLSERPRWLDSFYAHLDKWTATVKVKGA
jgi:hypothetical protein